jgi:hypothetical protein
MKDLGPLDHFLGVSVEQQSDDLFLHQCQYARDIFEHASMSDRKPCSTLVNTQAKVSSNMGASVSDLITYCSLDGALQYLTFTRPDIAYAVQQVCLHMHNPCEPHLTAAKRIIRYLQGTLDHGLFLRRASTSDLIIYTDTECASCPDTRRSTLGYPVFLGDNLGSWSSKRQNVVSHSSSETEYHTMANGVAEACWLRQILVELHNPLSWATLFYCNNVSTIYLSTNPVQHHRTKHVEIDLHFVRERIAVRDVRVFHVPTTSQFVDIFTKGLPSSVFSEFWSSLNIYSD